MARGDQLGRQWKIIQTLITLKKGKSAAELATDLDIHPRTVYRDLVALQVAGFPIYTERGEGGWQEPLVPARHGQTPHPSPLQPHRAHGSLLQHGHAQSLQGNSGSETPSFFAEGRNAAHAHRAPYRLFRPALLIRVLHRETSRKSDPSRKTPKSDEAQVLP